MDALQHDDQSVATLEENIARLRHLQAFGPLLSILPTCDEILLVVERCIETDRRPLLMTCKAMRKLVRLLVLLDSRRRFLLFSCSFFCW